jgi:alpha-beta hydrolase superfamily lysophospholipase
MVPSALRAADGVVLDAVLHLPTGDRPRGAVVQAHGINADMDEGGMFGRLAGELAAEGFVVLRFSFRGHGRSDGTQQGATIAGEILDLQAVLDAAVGFEAPVSVVAASFGAVSTCLSLPYLGNSLRSLVLWNPVLDLYRTFVEPTLPWAVENFGPPQQALLASQGFFSVEGTFDVGRVLFEEMRHYRPVDGFVGSRMPALVVHGDQEAYSRAPCRLLAAWRVGRRAEFRENWRLMQN